VAIIPCVIILICTPVKYLNVETCVNERKRIQKEITKEVVDQIDKSADMIMVSSDNESPDMVPNSPMSREEQLKGALEKNQKKKEKAMTGFTKSSNETLSQKIASMITNPVFCGLVATMSGLYFVVTGIQYWMSAYMITVMGATADMAALYYVVLTFTGPIVGVIAGGLLTSYVGGYNSTKG
jgi:hypothetical protein